MDTGINVNLQDAVGNTYLYRAYTNDNTWADKAGNYGFGYFTKEGLWYSVYLGETGSFKYRPIYGHERWAEAVRLGATHAIAHNNIARDAIRQAEEQALIAAYKPRLNTQHMQTGTAR